MVKIVIVSLRKTNKQKPNQPTKKKKPTIKQTNKQTKRKHMLLSGKLQIILLYPEKMRDKDNIDKGNSQHPHRFLYNTLHQTATSRRTPEFKHTVVPSNCSHRETVTAAFAWHYVKDNKPSQNWTRMKHHTEVSGSLPITWAASEVITACTELSKSVSDDSSTQWRLCDSTQSQVWQPCLSTRKSRHSKYRIHFHFCLSN